MSLTNPVAIADEGEMKDKWLQIRVDAEVKAMLLEVRRSEPDLPGDSEMVRLLIRRAFEALKQQAKKHRKDKS